VISKCDVNIRTADTCLVIDSFLIMETDSLSVKTLLGMCNLFEYTDARCACRFDVSIYKSTQIGNSGASDVQVANRQIPGGQNWTCPLSNGAMVIGEEPGGSASSARRIIYGTGHRRPSSESFCNMAEDLSPDFKVIAYWVSGPKSKAAVVWWCGVVGRVSKESVRHCA
jgi:hypothetical protein